MIQSPKNLTEQLLNLCERLAVEMRALFNTVDTKLGKTEKAMSAKTADTATTSVTATKATQDASGNIITSTYATKAEVTKGLAGKANASHTHTSASITDLSTTLAPYATTAVMNTELTKRAPMSHTHTIANVTGLQDALNAAIPKSGNRGAIAGYEQWTKVGATTTLSVSSGDSLLMETGGAAATITVQAGSIGQVATKLVWVNNSNKSITINGNIGWWAADVPTLNKATAVLLFFFHDGFVDCRLIGQWG